MFIAPFLAILVMVGLIKLCMTPYLEERRKQKRKDLMAEIYVRDGRVYTRSKEQQKIFWQRRELLQAHGILSNKIGLMYNPNNERHVMLQERLDEVNKRLAELPPSEHPPY